MANGHTATVGAGASVARVVERIKRLNKALPRASGERKTAMEAELASLQAQVESIKAVLG